MSVRIGEYNTLRVIKELDFGIYLDGGDELEILVPTRYVPENVQPDDEIEVFIYKDSEDRIIGTTLKPYGQVGDIVSLEVVDTNSYGVFMEWGLPKHLFVPFGEQGKRMKRGEKYVVKILLDERSDRIIGSAVEKHLPDAYINYRTEEEVDLMIYDYTDLGYKALINKTHAGVLFKNEVFTALRIGDEVKGYIKRVREDNKIDLTLRKKGYKEAKTATEIIIEKLKESKEGFLPYNDKTDAEAIYDAFGVSKKVFKAAIGGLYKDKLITLEANGIRIS